MPGEESVKSEYNRKLTVCDSREFVMLMLSKQFLPLAFK